MLQKLRDLRDLSKEFVMCQSPAEVYVFSAAVWVAGAMFGRWVL